MELFSGSVGSLTESQATRLADCEARIERGLQTFVEVGSALLEIRDARLYRQEHRTFEDYCRERWGMSRIHAHRLIESAEVVGNLLPMGNTPMTFRNSQYEVTVVPTNERQARPLTSLDPEEQREAWQRAVDTAPNGKVTAAHVQGVVDEIRAPHVSHNSGENEWYTPPAYIEAARSVLGEIDLDPASSTVANETVRATRFYTKEDDGLSRHWQGRVWLNPPYAQPLISQFAERLCHHVESGDVTEAVVLVNNATETTWFQRMAEQASAICFPRGRVRFLKDDGNPGAPLQGQAVIYIGDNTLAFTSTFASFGFVT